MTKGEQAVFELFDRSLGPSWEIYIQPHLNGLRPDFVLLNPRVGIAVFEVKDWNLDAIRYYVDQSSGYPKLMGDDSQKVFSLERQNPFKAVARYKEAIFNLYCPRLEEKFGFAAITGGVIFPYADSARIRKLQQPFLQPSQVVKAKRYLPVAGEQEIAAGAIDVIFPDAILAKSSLMTEALAQDLRGWLVEPDFSVTQREPLILDRNQRSLAESRTQSGYRRIKGPAGSGKSLVLAARAASLLNEGKSVLVASFNITLWHYLRDLIVRGVDSPRRMERVTFTHFHLWCREVCHQAELDEQYSELFAPVRKIENDRLLSQGEKAQRIKPIIQNIANVLAPALADKAVTDPKVVTYDAVLVDEGQDYRLSWWNALRKCCNADGELVLVADATQDVYGTARGWTEDVMSGAGFQGGRWAQLDVSYRLPPDALRMARAFAERYLPAENLHLPEGEQGSLDIYPCTLRWIQSRSDDAVRECVNAILAAMRETGKNGVANADITFLCNDTTIGKAVTDELQTYNVRAVHTFEPENNLESRRKKMGFFMGDARVKATTLHSFKGWEARLLVVHVGSLIGPESHAVIYAGLTRLKRSPAGSWLTVICSTPELAEFGQTWMTSGKAAEGT
ncbi:nuclease-related domain-containing DEAD/DEAH box helicase [Rhizobium ruizarguesonis]|uniref:nuclease-related domain-containing DEAD/DEAH box helicase n=1 Tax=Rhizobium ruizarguesonis TaxID=2081791 RepID=UPI001030E522|nr:NERD domain-containing protein [Rhizobium ruizarguesonis]TAY80983.1 DNA helicase [Rhizobium ruizarguesonis]